MLVERFQEGDATAFDTLYSRYFARLQRFCLKRVGDPHEAEEIAQEAFTRAYRALPTLAGERKFYPWMTVIAGRLCVDHHRRQGRTEPSDQIDLGGVDGGQDAIVEQADFALLTAALDRLAPRHREVLDMREHRGWSYQQIAEHYEVPVGTVEALLFRARKALKREFLAIAGSDRHAGLVAIPLVGGVFKKWAIVKAKVAGWASALPAGVAPVLGVAAVVGSAAVVGGTMLPDSAVGATRPPAIVRTVGSGVPASALSDAPVASGPSAVVAGTAGVAPAETPLPSDGSATNVRRLPVDGPVDVGSASDGDAKGEEHDTTLLDVGNTYARIDGVEITEKVDQVVAEWTKEL